MRTVKVIRDTTWGVASERCRNESAGRPTMDTAALGESAAWVQTPAAERMNGAPRSAPLRPQRDGGRQRPYPLYDPRHDTSVSDDDSHV